MFSEVTNDTRAETAQTAIDAFQRATRTDDDDALPDLLCNLMHWADQRNIDFLAMLNRGASHYQAEVEYEQDEGEEKDPAGMADKPHHYKRCDGPADL